MTNLEDCLILDDTENDLIKSQQGCPAYVSPEVLNPAQNYYSGKLSDSWSLGIVLYTLLFGRYPFHHNIITTMFAKIAKGKFQIPTNGITFDAKILLRSLIRLIPNERLLPNEILQHNWFKDLDFINNCKNFTNYNHQSPFQLHSQNSNDNAEQTNKNDYFLRQSSVDSNNSSSSTSSTTNSTTDEQSVPMIL